MIIEDDRVDMRTDSPADFSLKISGLPLDVTEEEIKKFFEEKFSRKNLKEIEDDVKVVRVCKAMKISGFIGMREKLKLMKKQRFKLNVKKQAKTDKGKTTQAMKIEKRLKKLNEEIDEIKASLRNEFGELMKEQNNKFSGRAFVTFEKMHHPEIILKKYKTNVIEWVLCPLKVKGLKLRGKNLLVKFYKGKN
jgi:RNA recognition motif-containing protein